MFAINVSLVIKKKKFALLFPVTHVYHIVFSEVLQGKEICIYFLGHGSSWPKEYNIEITDKINIKVLII